MPAAQGARLRSLLLFLLLTTGAFAQDGVVGKPLPSWQGLRWVKSAPQTQGHPVLIRFFTRECSLCSATVPSLLKLEHKFKGLVVIGIYHPKPRPREVPQSEVVSSARELKIDFPVAWDPQWTVLHRWWLDRAKSDYTSVSLLLDKQGVVRWVHPGGEYPPGSPEFKRLEAKLRELTHEQGHPFF